MTHSKTGTKISVFVVTHKHGPLPKRAPFIPIQVGNGTAIPGVTVRDNTKDNISSKNPNYCELTAHYWIWKNVKADIVGLCHYRRLPSFSGDLTPTFYDFSPETCHKFGWDLDTILSLFNCYDILMPPCWAIFPPGEPEHIMTPYEFHAYEHRESDIAETLKVIHDLTPEMEPFAHQALCVDKTQCFGNICLMRKPLFDAYSEWLFKILFELEQRIDIPESKEQARVFGFLSERLIMVWLAYAKTKLAARVWFAKMIPLGEFPEPQLNTTCAIARHEAIPNPRLSVIIPIYNVEKYLYRCLNSVCSQCEENIEIICVNDGSTDSSRAILDLFAERDKRIKIIDQPNRGQGAARNRGIEEAKGEYLAFVDSDDWVDRFIWFRSLRKMERFKLDLLLFEPQDFEDGTGKRIYNEWNLLRLPARCYQGAFTWREIERSPFDTCCYPPTRVIRKSFWGTRRFPEGVLYEDAVIHFDLLFSAKRIGAFACPFYFYRKRNNSTMSIRDLRVLDHLKVIDGVAVLLYKLGLFEQLEKSFLEYTSLLLRQTYGFRPRTDCFKALKRWSKQSPQSSWHWGFATREARMTYHLIRTGSERRFAQYCTNIYGESHTILMVLGVFLRSHLPYTYIIKQCLPYGLMILWLRKHYHIIEDRELLAYPGWGKRVKRLIKFALPYGIIRLWKKAHGL